MCHFWEWLSHWWGVLTDAEKASVIGAAIAAILGTVLGVVGGIVVLIPRWIVWRYKGTLVDLEDAKSRLETEARKDGAAAGVVIADDRIASTCGHSKFWIKRARRWERMQRFKP